MPRFSIFSRSKPKKSTPPSLSKKENLILEVFFFSHWRKQYFRKHKEYLQTTIRGAYSENAEFMLTQITACEEHFDRINQDKKRELEQELRQVSDQSSNVRQTLLGALALILDETRNIIDFSRAGLFLLHNDPYWSNEGLRMNATNNYRVVDRFVDIIEAGAIIQPSSAELIARRLMQKEKNLTSSVASQTEIFNQCSDYGKKLLQTVEIAKVSYVERIQRETALTKERRSLATAPAVERENIIRRIHQLENAPFPHKQLLMDSITKDVTRIMDNYITLFSLNFQLQLTQEEKRKAIEQAALEMARRYPQATIPGSVQVAPSIPESASSSSLTLYGARSTILSSVSSAPTARSVASHQTGVPPSSTAPEPSVRSSVRPDAPYQRGRILSSR